MAESELQYTYIMNTVVGTHSEITKHFFRYLGLVDSLEFLQDDQGFVDLSLRY